MELRADSSISEFEYCWVVLSFISFHFISFRFDRCLCYILYSGQVIIYDIIKGNSAL